jgi:RNA polymerase sigma factor (sigma-70 family)
MTEPSDELIPTRATLIQRLKDWQDQSSWQVFFDTYWKLIYDVARKGGLTGTEAQDAVQETMIHVARQMPTFKYNPIHGSFKSWLLNITRWRIIDQLRKRGPARLAEAVPREQFDDDLTSVSPEEKVVDPATADLDAIWEAAWEKNLLDAAVAKIKRRLDPQKFQIFDFCVNKDWAPEKVAATFNVSVDQIYLVKHRVSEMIKEEARRLELEMT